MADDLLQMQRQAARRVQQMQEHSRQVCAAHQAGLELASPGLYIRTAEPPVEPPAAPTPITLPHLDSDQWLILGLALLLFRNHCRPELTLALLYLAL